MYEKFRKLCALADNIGTVTEAMMYTTGYMTVSGKIVDGSDFTLTLIVKEEEKNGN